MKKLLLMVVMVMSACATVSSSEYQEMDSCPASMSSEQHLSGVVRCRALCSSYARDFAEYTPDCKCWCAPAAGSSPSTNHNKSPVYQNQM